MPESGNNEFSFFFPFMEKNERVRLDYHAIWFGSFFYFYFFTKQMIWSRRGTRAVNLISKTDVAVHVSTGSQYVKLTRRSRVGRTCRSDKPSSSSSTSTHPYTYLCVLYFIHSFILLFFYFFFVPFRCFQDFPRTPTFPPHHLHRLASHRTVKVPLANEIWLIVQHITSPPAFPLSFWVSGALSQPSLLSHSSQARAIIIVQGLTFLPFLLPHFPFSSGQ